MKKLHLLTLIAICTLVPLHAAYFIPVDGEYPTTLPSTVVDQIGAQMQTIADNYNTDDIVILAGNQEKFAQANNNSSSSTLLNGSLYTRTEIETIAIGIGSAVGTVDPSGFQTIKDDINSGKDSEVGAALNGLTIYLGYDGASSNLAPLKNILFSVKAGYLDVENLVNSFSFHSIMAGADIRYKFHSLQSSSKNVYIRPLTLGLGLYYIKSSIRFDAADLEQTATDNATGIVTSSVTSLEFQIENFSTTVPLEVVSSARFFGFFNVILGAGCDLSFGETNIDVNADSKVTVSHPTIPIQPIKAPDFELHEARTAENSKLFRPKVISGIGFEIAAVTIDIPVTYYPLETGFALSIIGAATF